MMLMHMPLSHAWMGRRACHWVSLVAGLHACLRPCYMLAAGSNPVPAADGWLCNEIHMQVREEVAKFIEARDNVPSNPEVRVCA